MSEDEENIRHYMPVVRRIIILVAVVTAIPVVMYTVTSFVRTYAGSHKTPVVQPLAASPSTQGATAAAGDNPAAQPPATMEANADAADGSAALAAGAATGTAPPDASAAPSSGAAAADASASAPTGTAAAPPGAAPNPADVASLNPGDPSAADPASSAGPAADGTSQDAAQPAAGTAWPAPPTLSAGSSADAQPSGQPISGPIPLPRQRPRGLVLAQVTQAGIPLPRARPDSAGPGAAAPSATPLTFLHNIFHSSSGTEEAPAASDSSGYPGYVETPH